MRNPRAACLTHVSPVTFRAREVMREFARCVVWRLASVAKIGTFGQFVYFGLMNGVAV